ncbi:MAG: DUF2950 domain-containing protein [Pyrinomonadaceae bacterium]|nr:DUF2950 domain-containing protein [Pyrinomonadaceae bacterium]
MCYHNKLAKKFRYIGLMAGAALLFLSTNTVPVTAQQLFDTPADAARSLGQAVKAKDQKALSTIFGPRLANFISGDPVADANDFEQFSQRIAESVKFENSNGQRVLLLIGKEEWPFAAPIIKVGDRWRFDTDAGVEEVLNRRIGMNEFNAMNLCQVYAIAQFEYFNGNDWDGDQVSEYATKISSTKGTRDGLFWEMLSEDDDESPLGSLFAGAALDGYRGRAGTTWSAEPFYGYMFKVLYRQGPSAPGGRFNYIINGNMIAGFGLVAYPATWGNSGVMTSIVNQEGRVYQKNLGPRTKAIAEAMIEYNPDVTWSLADIE